MPISKPNLNLISQSISDPYVTKRWRQEAQVSLQRNIIFFILHIILSSSSSEISTHKRQQGSLIISHIGVHTFYYETRALFSTTISQIYDKYIHEQVKLVLFYKSVLVSNTFLFGSTMSKIGRSQFGQDQV